MFSWAFNKYVPAWIAHVDSRFNAPIPCLVLVALLAEVGVYDAAHGGPINTQLTFVFIAVATQLVSVLALIVYPYRMRDNYRVSAAFVRHSIGTVPVITIVGALTLGYLVWLIAAFFIFPQARVAEPSRTLLPMAIVAAIGLAVYYLYRAQRLRPGSSPTPPSKLVEGT